MSPLRQYHGGHARLECRVPAALRAQLVALAEADRRSLNAFVVQRLEDGLEVWLDSQRSKRTHNPARRTAAYPDVEAQLIEIKARLKDAARSKGAPPMPENLTAKERAMMGLPPEQVPAAPGPDPWAELAAGLAREGYYPQGRRAEEPDEPIE